MLRQYFAEIFISGSVNKSAELNFLDTCVSQLYLRTSETSSENIKKKKQNIFDGHVARRRCCAVFMAS